MEGSTPCYLMGMLRLGHVHDCVVIIVCPILYYYSEKVYVPSDVQEHSISPQDCIRNIQ